MIRGETLVVHTLPIYYNGTDKEPINPASLKRHVVAGDHWRTGDIQHIALLGPADLGMDDLKHQFDALTDEEWLCAQTLAADGWHDTPEELIETAKELS